MSERRDGSHMKILLITHNPLSTYNNMGKTFLSLFSEFDRDELCQLYIHPSLPDVDICHAYYRITDREVLRSVYTRKAPGREITRDMMSQVPTDASNHEDPPAVNIKNKSSAIVRLGRDAVWKLSCWYSKKLKAWLDKEQPTCIFLAPGYAKFIYDVALRIAKDRRIPIATYICDDYYFVSPPTSVLSKLQLRLLKKKTQALMRRSSCVIGICDEIKDSYQKAFNVPAVKLMTGASRSATHADDRGDPQDLSYFGNVGCGRYASLTEIGQALEELNREKGTSFVLKIYTSEKDPEILGRLQSCPTVKLCGFVTGEALDQAMSQTGLLVHTEAFDEESIDLVKHSVSTKIADSLASGIPLFAYGPSSVASMKHLISQKCAITATSKACLKPMLEAAFFDIGCRADTVARALETAAMFHDSEKNSRDLQALLSELSSSEG